ncbi:MAG TPA: protein-disulfide reductase DsbD domain-containing protein, partial [Pyrinomonadaceae bacterium]|nr:protein-disulfide reductase DsbD domain-containing protein [Pyrinomonadaceae bacterium]
MRLNFQARLARTLLALAALLAPQATLTQSARATTTHESAATTTNTTNAATARAWTDASASTLPPLAVQASNVGINGYFSVDPAQQGSTFQAAVVFDIPEGMHVNSNRPLGKYAIATSIKVEAPRGLRATPVVYPPGKVRSFKFGEGTPEEKLAVYEGSAVARFNVGVPADFAQGVAHVKVSVRFQACNNEVCFPPAT